MLALWINTTNEHGSAGSVADQPANKLLAHPLRC